MKTLEEIKKAVRLCILSGCCEACPYHENASCSIMLILDVSACIEQLEQLEQLESRVKTNEE